MHISSPVENTIDVTLPMIKILLAESDLAEVDRIKSTIAPEFQIETKIVKTYYQLVESVLVEQYSLLILGKIDNANYSEIAKKCYQTQKNMPIVLLSSQGVIIDSFRQLVKNCGLTDVISRDTFNLNQLIIDLNKSIHQSDRESLEKQTYSRIERPSIEPKVTENIKIKPQPQALPKPKISARMMLVSLEEIVAVSNNYFGPLAQGNYWRKAHARSVDEFPFVHNWSADHFSKLSCHEKILERELTSEEIQSLRVWVQFFIEECERIIVDFRTILSNSNLPPIAIYLLSKN